MAELEICVRFQVSGRVQGVGFRYAAMQEANRLDVTGWVKNRPNGDVVLLACGNERQVNDMEQWLRHGPRFAKVDELTCEKCHDTAPEEFVIR